MSHTYTSLLLPAIDLAVCLGWPNEERQTRQFVKVDIKIFFPLPPAACYEEKLNLTICYHTLINNLQNFLADKSFRLIEFFTFAIYKFLKKSYPDLQINVRVKKFPPVPALSSGVCFFYGDETESW